jgi:hypothetical protein
MDIDNLTLGQIKQLQSLFSSQPNITSGSNIGAEAIGKYVIVRTRNEGLNAGYVKALDNTGIILTEARRIWYHKPSEKSQCWYEGVANVGLDESSKLSAPVDQKIIIEDYSITFCSKKAQKSLKEFPAYEQN